MVNEIKLACCGDICNLCPRYIATLSNSEEKLKEAAILFEKVGWREKIVAAEDMICYGCKSFDEICEYNVRECCIERKIENCGKCNDYPCNKIENAFEITKKNREKFRDILSKEEYEIFKKAFFLKKENLDKVRNGVIEDISK